MIKVTELSQIEDNNLREFIMLLETLAKNVYEELGAGFPEHIYQKALALEMRNAGIRFQTEVNIEIYYKGVPLGSDRPDFMIRPFSNEKLCVNKPIVVELKVVSRLRDENIIQGQTYLISLPNSSDEELKSCSHCILINFPKNGEGNIELILLQRHNT